MRIPLSIRQLVSDTLPRCTSKGTVNRKMEDEPTSGWHQNLPAKLSVVLRTKGICSASIELNPQCSFAEPHRSSHASISRLLLPSRQGRWLVDFTAVFVFAVIHHLFSRIDGRTNCDSQRARASQLRLRATPISRIAAG